MNSKLDRIELEVKDIKNEIGLEVNPSYIKKLKSIQSQKGKIFNKKNDFLAYLKNEI